MSRTLLQTLVTVAFGLAALAPYTITGFLLTGDLRDVALPLEDFYRRELAAERLPLWDPTSALGYPVLASGQLGFWYPPLFVLRALPPEPALAIALLAHAAFLSVGVLVYARSLGLSPGAALLTAVAFTGNGFAVGHLTHVNIFFAVAWLPWVLLLTDRLASTLRPRTGLVLAIVLALQALTGHLHTPFLTFLLVLARFVARLRARMTGVSWQHIVWTSAALLMPIGVGLVLLASVQVLPTLELLRESSRGLGGGFDLAQANQHSFPPWQAVTFLVPAFFGFPDLSEYWGTRPLVEMGAWVGALPLLLAGVGARRTTGRFWVFLALAGFFLSLGRWSPVRLLGIEPTLGIFSSPARYLLFTHFGLAVLAGMGLDRLQRPIRHVKWVRAVGSGGIVVALLVVASFLVVRTQRALVQNLGETAVDRFIVGRPEHVLPRTAYVEKVAFLTERLGTWGVNLGNPSILFSTALLGLGGAILLIGTSRKSISIYRTIFTGGKFSKFVVPVVCALTAVELVAVAWQVHPTFSWTEVLRTPPVVAALPAAPDGRLYVVHPQGDTGLLFANPTTPDRHEHDRLLNDLAVANIPTRFGFSTIEWPAALDLKNAAAVIAAARDAFGRPVNEALLDRLGVRYLAGSSATPDLDLPPPARVLANFTSGEGRTITVWERPTARPRTEVLAELPLDIRKRVPESAGHATIVSETPERIAIDAENLSDRQAALLLRDAFYPGWVAAVDGEPAAIERADSIFRGVRLPSGPHQVEFTYRPWSARTGLLISAAAWTLALAALALRRRIPPFRGAARTPI